MNTLLNVERLRGDILNLLQDGDDKRVLDSIEVIVVKTAIHNQGIEIPDGHGPAIQSVEGWLTWLKAHSLAG